jgi:spore maturation protein A
MCLYLKPDAILPTMLTASRDVIELAISLVAIYSVWLGILQIMQDSGLNAKLSKVLKPATGKLFGKLDDKTNEYICLNISANMLGMGGAATPMGIKAMQSMDDGSGVATPAMIMFFVLNATSLQLLPTTVIALRTSSGSLDPTSILLPSLIATIVSSLVGFILVKICQKLFSKKRVKK